MLFLRKLRSRERTGFCRQKLCWTVENNWSKVIFNEETKVVLGEDKKIYVWRKSTERLLGECTGMLTTDREKQGTISAMFWGCISYDGVGTITLVNGNMNSNSYIETLNNNLWPVITKKKNSETSLGYFKKIMPHVMFQDNIMP